MMIKDFYHKVKLQFTNRKKLVIIISLFFTLLFSIYNRIIGAIKGSLWNEAISIYYFVLVLIKSIIYIYMYGPKNRTHDVIVFKITKVLLFILNILLIVPITLMVVNKRPVEMSLIFSIAIALYVTIKTTKTIINFTKRRDNDDLLSRELRTIDLVDVVVSILTLQNTLIAVNGEFDQGMYYLTILTSLVGFLFNIILISKTRKKEI